MSNDNEEQRGAPTLTYSQARNRADEVHARMEQINELDKPTDEEDAEFRELGEEFDSLLVHMNRLERAAELARVESAHNMIGKPQTRHQDYRLERGTPSQGSRGDYDRDAILEPDSIPDARFKNPWDLSEVRTLGREDGEVAAELRARALCALERVKGTSDNVRQAATTIIERYDDSKSTLAKMCLATSNPAYVRAWSKLARDRGHELSIEERRAITEVRAMSLTDAAGGFLVPFQLDPTVIITSDGVRSDIRDIARTVVATGDVWNGVSSVHVSWSWDAEAAQVSDDAPAFAQPTIPNYKAAGFVPISLEALMDEANVTQEVGRLLAGGKADLEGAAFITGSGGTQPTGLITALVASSPSVITLAAADDTFAIGDVYKVQGALPARYRANAKWLANNLIYNIIRGFGATYGASFWTDLGGDRPPRLLGRDVYEAESMDGVVTTTGAVANYILVYGDFSNFVITDRIGMSVEFIPHLFGANQRPTGQRGWYAYYRTGSDSVNDGGFRLLNVASAA
jgi:HK97 family phage major capsid protein